MKERLNIDVEDIIKACKEIKSKRLFNEFQEKAELTIKPIKNLLEEEGISQEEIFDRIYREELERFENELRNQLKAEEEKEIPDKTERGVAECQKCKSKDHVVRYKDQKGVKTIGAVKYQCKKCGDIFYAHGKSSKEKKEPEKEMSDEENEEGEDTEKTTKDIADEPEITSKTEGDIQEERPECSNCKSNAHVVKYGKRKTKAGERQIWSCGKCERRFVVEKGRPGYSKEIRKKAIMLSKEKDRSSREIVKLLEKENGIEIAHKTITNWIKESKMRKYAWGLFNNVGEQDYRRIAVEIKKKFNKEINKSDIAQWIEEEIKRRGGRKCGEMNCFGDSSKDPEEKPELAWCKGRYPTRRKNQYICEEKIIEISVKK